MMYRFVWACIQQICKDWPKNNKKIILLLFWGLYTTADRQTDRMKKAADLNKMEFAHIQRVRVCPLEIMWTVEVPNRSEKKKGKYWVCLSCTIVPHHSEYDLQCLLEREGGMKATPSSWLPFVVVGFWKSQLPCQRWIINMSPYPTVRLHGHLVRDETG